MDKRYLCVRGLILSSRKGSVRSPSTVKSLKRLQRLWMNARALDSGLCFWLKNKLMISLMTLGIKNLMNLNL